MNIFNKVTLQSLKKNKARTIITIIGMILSVSMITAVTTFVSSFQTYLIDGEIARSGNWHIEFIDVDSKIVESISSDEEVQSYGVMQNFGYARLEGGTNENKPYLYVTGLGHEVYNHVPVKLTSGRLPQNSSEVVIPEHIATNGGVVYTIGDRLTLELGSRMLEGKKIGQHNSFQSGEFDNSIAEVFQPETIKTYTVVGISERPVFEEYSAPGYTLITTPDEQESSDYSLFVNLKHPGMVYSFTEKIGEDNAFVLNTELLRFMGVSDNDNFNTVLYSLGGILIALIMIGSILLIYNSFAISVSERARQFGILSSVGATAKQLRKSVLFEGFCIGLCGIPLGIIAGIGGIGITLHFVGGLFKDMTASNVPLKLSPSLSSIVIAVIVSLVTILLSAYIPANSATKRSAIDSIRQTDDIKITPKEIKTSRLTQRVFGLEGMLARKNFKRNKKRYRSVVISLFVSVVLFISASAFGMYLKQAFDISVERTAYDISFSAGIENETMFSLYDEMKTVSGVYGSAYASNLAYVATISKSSLSERYRSYDFIIDSLPGNEVNMGFNIVFIKDEAYNNYITGLGISDAGYVDANITKMLAFARVTTYDMKLKRYIDFDILSVKTLDSHITSEAYISTDGSDEVLDPVSKDVSFTFVDEMPKEVSMSQYSGFIAFAPYSAKPQFAYATTYNQGMTLTFLSSDPARSATEMDAILKDWGLESRVLNLAAQQEEERSLLLVINVFTYGFVVLISLIAVANVFNTISTNMNLRRREFAMLRSVGMTDKDFNRMMNYECIFYGLKALLFGLPVAGIVTYFIYNAVMNGVDVAFSLPWSSIAISIFSVFFVVFVTIAYSARKVKQSNVVDALRNEVA